MKLVHGFFFLVIFAFICMANCHDVQPNANVLGATPNVDLNGVPISAANVEAVEALNKALMVIVKYAASPEEHIEAALKADPLSAMAHLWRAICTTLALLPREYVEPAIVAARGVLEQLGENALWREKQLLEAVDLFSLGHHKKALNIVEGVLIEYPLDMWALRFAADGYLFNGDSRNYRDTCARVLDEWEKFGGDCHGAVLGMLAFGYGECNQFHLGRKTGLRALTINPDNVWAIHAVSHSYEYEGRPSEGLAFLESVKEYWSKPGILTRHVWWHYGLFAMQTQSRENALSLYDHHMRPEAQPFVTFPLVDASSFLWRMVLNGWEVDAERWSQLSQYWNAFVARRVVAFDDAHAQMAFSFAQSEASNHSLEFLEEYAMNEKDDRDNRIVTKQVGLDAARAIKHFAEGKYDEAASLLMPIRYQIHFLGMSNAQRDVFAKTLIYSLFKGGNFKTAAALLSERRALHGLEGDPWTLRLRESVSKVLKKRENGEEQFGEAGCPNDVQTSPQDVTPLSI